MQCNYGSFLYYRRILIYFFNFLLVYVYMFFCMFFFHFYGFMILWFLVD